MTVEGENDDISGIGQTQAAHGLCSALPEALKEDYVQPGVGHYGVFNGRRFREEIYPRVRDFILKSDPNVFSGPCREFVLRIWFASALLVAWGLTLPAQWLSMLFYAIASRQPCATHGDRGDLGT
jgi:hypothetical protein